MVSVGGQHTPLPLYRETLQKPSNRLAINVTSEWLKEDPKDGTLWKISYMVELCDILAYLDYPTMAIVGISGIYSQI